MLRAKLLPALVAIVLATTAGAVPVLAASGPTSSQIRKAVAAARRSKNLWATINVCGPRSRPHTIGVRAQMPALGFATQLSVRIQVEYWSVGKQRFVSVLDSNARAVVALGTVTAGLQQGGENFVFKHGAYMRATVTFTYRRHGQRLLTVTRHTVGGHPHADQGIPPHYSAATCRLR